MGGELEPWLGRLIDPGAPPTTIDEFVARYDDACQRQLTAEQIDAVVEALRLYYKAIAGTPGMVAFLERWMKESRALGNRCPTERVLFLARESGCYATAMPSATADENVVLAAYDARLAELLLAEPRFAVVAAGVCIAYVLPLAGLESQFARRAFELLSEMGDADERRAALGMTEHHEFENADIAEMTRISVGEARQLKRHT